MNPSDNQGVRYLLAELLLTLSRHERLQELLDAYPEDGLAAWAYIRALLVFQREGDSAEALRCLRDAIRANRFVPAFLLGKLELPPEQPTGFSLGSKDEPVSYALDGIGTWALTPGALAWLAKRTGKRGR
ncbi:MAG TPA: hypothetical protein VOA87_01120 [Thermoanaerobaculia bacterium]|nr:hypothetical protein [Thermoanaerobaculia bacterium]